MIEELFNKLKYIKFKNKLFLKYNIKPLSKSLIDFYDNYLLMNLIF